MGQYNMYTLEAAKYGKELNGAVSLAHLAGSVMLHYYDLDYSVSVKESEHSPEAAIFTEVDGRIDKIVQDYVKQIWPDDQLLTEETDPDKDWFKAKRIWTVDPIDGTMGYRYNIPEFRCLPGVLMGTAAAHSLALASLHNPCRVGSS